MGIKYNRGKTGDTTALELLLAVVFAALGWMAYNGIWARGMMIAAGLGILALLLPGDLRRLAKLPTLLLLAHAAFTMLTIFWAISGKFFLGRYAATFIGVFFFLYAVLRGKGNPLFAHRAVSVCALLSTIYAVLSVEAASTGAFLRFMNRVKPDNMRYTGMYDNRMYGIFANSNMEASFFALGVLLGIGLICGAGDNRKRRALWSFTTVCCAYALLLSMSIGALACFGVAVIVYLIAAGKERAAVLTRMLLGAAFSFAAMLVWAGVAHSAANASEWIIMLAFAAAAAFAELAFGERAADSLRSHEKATFTTAAVLIAAVLVYLLVGSAVTGAYTFREGGETIRRSAVLRLGEQTVSADADEGVAVEIYSRTSDQIMTYDRQLVYAGSAKALDGAKLQVLEGDTVCEFYFKGEPGKEIRTMYFGDKKIPLGYTILPGFISHRLVNLSGSSSLQQRLVYLRDAMKLFRDAPLAGQGSGAFELAILGVQSFEYETVHSHNQYVESLVEGGVIGFVLFTGAVLMFGAALWSARRKERREAWVYPMLCAEFTMSALQMLWDATMIMAVFVSMLYLLYGMIAETCAAPLAAKKRDEEESAEYVPARAKAEKTPLPVRLVCCVLPLLFVVSVGCNLHANALINSKADSLDTFMANLVRAQKWDLYEKDDAKLSYVRAEIDYDLDDGVYRETADRYAKELSTVQSNTIPYLLLVYYLNTGRYYEGIDEAMLAAKWTGADSDTWNKCIDALKQAFLDSRINSPLISGKNELLTKLLEYENALVQRNESSVKPIVLTENSKVFFEAINVLSTLQNDQDAMRKFLITGEL